MINKRETRKYDDEFKKETIALAKSSDKSIAKIAKDLGISANNIYYWIKREEKIQNREELNKTKKESFEEENKRLKKELEDARIERDILKKVVAIFSKQPK